MGNINGLHVLIFALVVGLITIVVIVRSPQAPQEDIDDGRDTRFLDQYLPNWQRAVVATFVANALGYGSEARTFLRVRASVSMHHAYDRLVDAIENARRIYGIPQGQLSDDDCDRLVTFLVNDKGFILACAGDSAFVMHMADTAYSVTTPDDEAIPERLIPREVVLIALGDMRAALWAKPQPEGQ